MILILHVQMTLRRGEHFILCFDNFRPPLSRTPESATHIELVWLHKQYMWRPSVARSTLRYPPAGLPFRVSRFPRITPTPLAVTSNLYTVAMQQQQQQFSFRPVAELSRSPSSASMTPPMHHGHTHSHSPEAQLPPLHHRAPGCPGPGQIRRPISLSNLPRMSIHSFTHDIVHSTCHTHLLMSPPNRRRSPPSGSSANAS